MNGLVSNEILKFDRKIFKTFYDFQKNKEQHIADIWRAFRKAHN